MPEESEDFLHIIEKAQRVNKDMGSLFGDNTPGRVAFEAAPQRAAGPDLDWDAHCDVFNLPADRDLYQDTLNQILRGEATLRFEDRTFDKEGNYLVAICYLTPRQRPQPAADEDAGDAEPVARPHKIP